MEGFSNILAEFLKEMGALGPFHRFWNQFIVVHCNSCYVVFIYLLYNEFIMVLLHMPLAFIVLNESYSKTVCYTFEEFIHIYGLDILSLHKNPMVDCKSI